MPTGSMPGYGSPGTTTPTTIRPYAYGDGIKNRAGHSPLELCQGCGPLRDRRSAIDARAYTRAVRRDRRLDADQDAGRPDLGVSVRPQAGQGQRSLVCF